MPYSYPQPIDRSRALQQKPHLFAGGAIFAGIAGFINAVALAFFHSPVSHMTGTVSYLGIELAGQHMPDALATAGIVSCFVTGAMIGGWIIGAHALLPSRRYGAALMVEGALICIAMQMLQSHHRLGVTAIAMACGLQNATTSSYFGLMIRTTHVTGTVTDIGVMFGHWIHHRKVDRIKLLFMLMVVTSFGVGIWLGAIADSRWGPLSLAFPAMGCGGAGIWLALNPLKRIPRITERSRS